MLSERLKKLRKERGMYQKEVCEKIGIAQNTLSGYENGDRTPSPKIIKKLAELYGVTTDYLMGNDMSMADLEEEFPEGVQVLRRATKELTPEARAKMIKLMKAFLEEDN